MPAEGLHPACVQGLGDDDFKPAPVPAFWSSKAMSQWLLHTCGDVEFDFKSDEFMHAPHKDERIHVSIDPVTGMSDEGKIFSTVGLDFKHSHTPKGEDANSSRTFSQLRIALQAQAGDNDYGRIIGQISTMHPMGGERRLTQWQSRSDDTIWSAPDELGEKIKRHALRMVLVTPGIFSRGWLPGWIEQGSMTGAIPGTDVNVKLISAVTGRWQPISGWSYESGKNGPKPIRRMVPAGSVYFFDFLDDDSRHKFDLKSVWLSSVSDNEQDRNDGFGASLWGAWKNTTDKTNN